MINGIERKRFVIISSVLYIALFSSIPPGFVTVRIIPKLSPKTKPILPAQATIRNVSWIASIKSGHLLTRFGNILSTASCISDHLHSYIIFLHIFKCCIYAITLAFYIHNRTPYRCISNSIYTCKKYI